MIEKEIGLTKENILSNMKTKIGCVRLEPPFLVSASPEVLMTKIITEAPGLPASKRPQ